MIPKEVRIAYAQEQYFDSFRMAIDEVSREEVYIARLEGPSLEMIRDFYHEHSKNNWPAYHAVDQEKVVGWIDITPHKNPMFQHRAQLGMGVLRSHRGAGIGTRLLSSALEHAKTIGIEKVELTVYPDNIAAIQLYKKFGFENSGYIKHFRKLRNQYFDAIEMEKFL